MARTPGLTPDAAPEHVQKIYAGVERVYGKMLEPIAVAAHSPEVLAAMLAFEREVRNAPALEPRLKQLANLKTATLVGCPFCIDIGSAESADAGVTVEQVQALNEYETSAAFSSDERLALDYAVAMTRTPLEIDDAFFERLRARFTEAQLVELTAVIAWENFRSRFNHAFGIKAHGFAENGVCALPA
jgi:4-carboxymuconolactone decarboxylase